jgi:hypothetical protein
MKPYFEDRMSTHLGPDQLYLFHERAAIMEFDGGMTRHEAETKAAAEMRAQGDLFGGEAR